MKQHFKPKKQVSVIHYKAIIIYQALHYPSKKKQSPSAYGVNGTNSISKSIKI